MPATAAAQPAEFSPDEAQGVLFDRVVLPVFCDRLAAHGLPVKTAADREAAAEMCVDLILARRNAESAQAAAGGDGFFKQAAARIAAESGRQPTAGRYDAFAAQAAADPSVLQAAVGVSLAEALAPLYQTQGV